MHLNPSFWKCLLRKNGIRPALEFLLNEGWTPSFFKRMTNLVERFRSFSPSTFIPLAKLFFLLKVYRGRGNGNGLIIQFWMINFVKKMLYRNLYLFFSFLIVINYRYNDRDVGITKGELSMPRFWSSFYSRYETFEVYYNNMHANSMLVTTHCHCAKCNFYMHIWLSWNKLNFDYSIPVYRYQTCLFTL